MENVLLIILLIVAVIMAVLGSIVLVFIFGSFIADIKRDMIKKDKRK